MIRQPTLGRSKSVYALAICVLCALALGAATAGAASASNLVIKYEEGKKQAAENELAGLVVEYFSPSLSGGCFGDEGEARIGKNPAGTAVVLGSGNDFPFLDCFGNGAMFVHSLKVTKSGIVKLTLDTTFEGGEPRCKYELTKLSGHMSIPSSLSMSLTGTAKLQKHVTQPPGCVKSGAVEGRAEGYSEGFGWPLEVSLIA